MTVLARQQAENLARWQLPDVAQARALARVKEAFRQLFQDALGSPDNVQELVRARLGPVPEELREKMARLGLGKRIPTGNQLDDLVGQWLGSAGKGISGRMVRNYLSILRLPPEALELAEAASIPEFTLRIIRSFPDPEAQVKLVRMVAAQGLSPQDTKRLAAELAAGKKKTRQKPLAERLGKGLLRLARQLEDMSETDLSELARQLVEREDYEPIRRAISTLRRLWEAMQEVQKPL